MLDASAPCANESVVESAADRRACQRQQPANPFFRGLLPELYGQARDEPRHELFRNLFPCDLFAVIHAGGRRNREPQMNARISIGACCRVAQWFEAVEQAQALDQPQR